MSHHEGHESKFFTGLVYGLILGAGFVMFLKTKEGQKLSKDLLSSGEEMVDKLASSAIEFSEETKKS